MNSSPSRSPLRRTIAKRRSKIRNLLSLAGVILIFVEITLLRIGISLDGVPNKEVETPFQKLEADAAQLYRPPDGEFNGIPVYHKEVTASTKPYSLQHCVGENYQKQNWMHRSCRFRFLCFDLEAKEFTVFRRPEDDNIRRWSDQVPLMDISQTFIRESSTVSLGGINLKWGGDGVARLEWFPRIARDPPSNFYALPEDIVLIPYHSMAGWNPGHLVWDDFLPIYTLMSMFQFEEQHEALMLRYVLPGETLWASCDTTIKSKECLTIQNKFWPLMMSNYNQSLPTTQLDVQLKLYQNEAPRSNFVCAKNGLAGIGALTDHGTQKLHGWHKEDYQISHNHGRAGLFWNFRTYCLKNLAIQEEQILDPPYKIIFSALSSTNPARNLDFTKHETILQRKLDPLEVTVESHILKDLTLQEQVKLATQTSIFITGCGGGAVTATFLPKGATLIIFYNEVGGRVGNKQTNLPARLDWDYFNNLAYINVHWFPSGTRYNAEDLASFLSVVRDDLNRRRDRHSMQF